MLIGDVLIMLVSLLLGLISGAVMQRSDFCLAGIFRDCFLLRRSPLLPSLVLSIAVSMLLIEGGRLTGIIDYRLPSSLYGLPSMTTVAGGLLFGFGMVLAGGCVVGSLYKAATGSLASVIAIVGMLFGSVVYAEFHLFWQHLARATVLSEAATVPQLLNLNPSLLNFPVGLLLAAWVRTRHRRGELYRPSYISGYLQPGYAAVLLAIVGFLSLVLLGMPLGITTTYAKVGAFFEHLLFPEHVAANAYFSNRAFIYYSPLSGTDLTAGPGPFFDGLSLVQFPLIFGILIGSWVSSLLLKSFYIRWKLPLRQCLLAGAGGILMGLASRMSPACNVWHLLGGVPVLSLQSLAFVFGMLPGVWLGSRLVWGRIVTSLS